MGGTTRQIRRAALALAATALGTALLGPPAVAPALAATTGAIAYDTPGEHHFIVPAGVFWLRTEVEGGHGGGGGDIAHGGHGGIVKATFPVTPHETLRVVVGAYGGGSGGQGWAHGGDHGTADGALNDCYTGAGGGGSSAVARGGTALLAAGGGGGGGGDCGDNGGGRGGDGGSRAGAGGNSDGYEPPDTGTAGCGGCRDHHDGEGGHDATYDESGGGGGGGGGGATRGGGGGEDGTVGFGKTGTGGGGGGAGDSVIAVAGALNTELSMSVRPHHGAVALYWGMQPHAVKPEAGGGQSTVVLGRFATGLRALVTDADNVPSVGVNVRFTLPSTGASGTFPGGATTAVARTGRDGIAAAPALQANAIAGEWYAAATVDGVPGSAHFALENLAASTTTAAVPSANPSVTGQPVTLTATVRSSVASAPPSGRVQFVVDGAPFGDPVALDDGEAVSGPITGLDPGDHPVAAEFLGDAGHKTSSWGGTLHVAAAPTATTVTSTLNPAGVGDTVAFTAQVDVSPPASGVPDGTVQFARDGIPFGLPVTLDAAGRAVSQDQMFLAEGAFDVTATYVPAGAEPRYEGSSGRVTQSVGAEATATQLSASANPSAAGQPVLLTAQVRRQDPGAPVEGTMTFLLDGAPLCPSVTVVGREATCALPADLAPGSYDLRADFTGAAGYEDSRGTHVQRVVVAATRTVVTAERDPSPFGTDVRLRAVVGVVAPGVGTPEGTVQFSVDGGPAGAPVAVAGGVAESDPIADLARGSHRIEADFTPAARYGPSHGAGSLLVDAVATTATLTSDASPARAGQPIRFIATIAPVEGDARPTGLVQLLVDGGAHGAPVPLAGGRATFAPEGDLGVGTYEISAHYHGYGPYKGSDASMQQVVVPAPAPGSTSADSLSPLTDEPPPGADGPGLTPVQPLPTLVLGAGVVAVDGRGTARLDGHCLAAPGQRCTGTVTLRTEPVSGAGDRTARGGLVAATRRVSLAAGERTRLALDVTRTAERILDRRGRVRTVTEVGGVAADAGAVVLRAARAPALDVLSRRASADPSGRIHVRVHCGALEGRHCHGLVRAGRYAPATKVRIAGGAIERVALRLPGADDRLTVRVRTVSRLTVGPPRRTSQAVEVTPR